LIEVKPKHLSGVIAGLFALWYATGSIHAHVPKPAFRNKLGRSYKEEANKILRWMSSYGFAQRKGGTNSWRITERGKRFLEEKGYRLYE